MNLNFPFYPKNVFSFKCTKPKQAKIFRSYFTRVNSELQELMYPAMDYNRIWKTELSPMITAFMQNPNPDDQESCFACLSALRAFDKRRQEVEQHLIENWPRILQKQLIRTKEDSIYLKNFADEQKKIYTEINSRFNELVKIQKRLDREKALEDIENMKKKKAVEEEENNENEDNNKGVEPKVSIEEKKNNKNEANNKDDEIKENIEKVENNKRVEEGEKNENKEEKNNNVEENINKEDKFKENVEK